MRSRLGDAAATKRSQQSVARAACVECRLPLLRPCALRLVCPPRVCQCVIEERGAGTNFPRHVATTHEGDELRRRGDWRRMLRISCARSDQKLAHTPMSVEPETATRTAATAPMARAPMARLAPLRPLQSNADASSSSLLQPLKPLFKQPLAATSVPAASSSAAASSADSSVAELLELVRQRYPDEPKATAAAAAASPPAVPLAAATASSASFSEAANSAQVDKLAVLMSLFKSRGIQPPPLPMFETFESLDDEQPTATDGSVKVDKIATSQATASQGPAVAAAADSKSSEWQEPTAAIAAASAATDRSAAEVAQLTALFEQARNKVTKLCRLYQSGVLKGAGATQAVAKLSALLRTYYAFIQHSKTHPHISAVCANDPAIAGDVACSSLQQLADRTYAQCKA